MVLGVLLALLAAVANAASNVLQRLATQRQPGAEHLSPKLVWHLLHARVWWVGFVAVVASFVCQAGALRYSSLTLVQPIVVLELPVTLIGAGVLFHSPLQRREWAAVVVMAAGLAVFVTFLAPGGGGDSTASATAWGVGVGASLAVIAVLAVVADRHVGGVRAALLGSASGIGFGMTAAFTKAATDALSGGVVGLLSSWSTYALALSGLGALFLMQHALQAGPLVAAQPPITMADPVASVLWGVLAFHEPTDHGPLLVLAALGAVAMVAGSVLLSRSALLDPPAGEPVRA